MHNYTPCILELNTQDWDYSLIGGIQCTGRTDSATQSSTCENFNEDQCCRISILVKLSSRA